MQIQFYFKWWCLIYKAWFLSQSSKEFETMIVLLCLLEKKSRGLLIYINVQGWKKEVQEDRNRGFFFSYESWKINLFLKNEGDEGASARRKGKSQFFEKTLRKETALSLCQKRLISYPSFLLTELWCYLKKMYSQLKKKEKKKLKILGSLASNVYVTQIQPMVTKHKLPGGTSRKTL